MNLVSRTTLEGTRSIFSASAVLILPVALEVLRAAGEDDLGATLNGAEERLQVLVARSYR